MSNILIIKHGSLGDISQISGVLKDIKETFKNKKIFLLTTRPYVELFTKCPYLDGVLMDKRLPRWNVFYLIKLKRMLEKFNFTNVYDLQNSSRTSFYRKYLLRNSVWSSTETILKENENKKDFENDSVLERFKIQLDRSKVSANYTLKPDFSWAADNVDDIVKKVIKKKFILIFPFCSPNLSHKKWPYYNDLINLIKTKHKNFEIVIAPGPNEIKDAEKFESVVIKKENKPLNIRELAGLILKASYVIANDTGPAHMTAHLGKSGIVLFGHHTTPKKVSIETDKFKALTTKDLNSLTCEMVYSKIKSKLELIN